MDTFDKAPLSRRQLEIVIAATKAVLEHNGRLREPWAFGILTRLRGMYVLAHADDSVDCACPPLQDALPFPVSIPSGGGTTQPRSTRRIIKKGAGEG